nr:virulence-associated E family protein [Lachnospiraceae bacterium]
NNTQFLPVDRSGNRRFLPIEVNMREAECHILENEAASRAYIEQLWAEVMEIYMSGKYTLKLSDNLYQDLILLQERHCPEDPMETSIRNFLEETAPEYVCAKMLFYEALNHTNYENPQQWESTAIGEIMDQKMKDYKRISSHHFKEYGTQRAWVLTKDPGFKSVKDSMEEENPFFDGD